MRSLRAVVYAAGPPRDRWTIGTLCAPSRRDVSSTRCPSNRSFRLYTKQHYQDQDIKDLKANARMTSLYVIAIHFKSDLYIYFFFQLTAIIVDIILAVQLQCDGAITSSPSFNAIAAIFAILQRTLPMTRATIFAAS